MAKARRNKLSKKPYGIASFAKKAYDIGKKVFPIAKKIYNHPVVQKKWTGYKKKHNLEWLPFGKRRGKRLPKGRIV